MSKGLFITGTDTGVGKTYYTCCLLRSLNNHGYRTAAIKPVASGADRMNGKLRNEDALQLQQAMSLVLPYEQVNPYCFSAAIAPHLAAQQAGVAIDLHELQNVYVTASRQADITLVEGVGGWQVPLDRQHTLADLAVALQLPVILVVGMRLGCINHALLTATNILQSGVELVGWVANVIDPVMPALLENIETIEQRLQVPLLHTLGFNSQNILNIHSLPL